MQSWIYIVLGLLIVVLVVALFVAFRRVQNEKEINQLNEDFEAMTSQPIYKTIEQLDAMNLTGESHKSLEKWRGAYYDLINNKFGQLYQSVFDAEKANQNFKIFTSKKRINASREQLKETQSDSQDVIDSLDQLVKSSEQNKVQGEKLSSQYRAMRKEVLTKSFDYGDSVDEFEDRLSDVDKQFETIRKLTSAGDHLEAKKVLADIAKKLNILSDILKRIPPRYHELVTEFPDQLSEIKQYFEKMRTEHYSFGEPGILESIAMVHNKIAVTLTALSKLELQVVEQNNKSIVKSIDDLYQRLQDELEAKKKVAAIQKEASEYLNHSSVQITNLIMSLDHLNQSYVLTHNELDDARQMQSEIADMQKEYDRRVQEIADHQAVYTATFDSFEAIAKRLGELEQKQYQINDSVSGLFEGERVAKQGVTQFEIDLKDIQREVEQANLPGVPKDFVDYFTMVREEVAKLDDNLNQVQINIEDITKQLIMTQEDLNTLTQKAKDMKDAAILTEQALQYANRYTYGNEALAGAAAEAKRIYTEDHNYQQALDTIATALDQVEPGSFKRIESLYYNSEDATDQSVIATEPETKA